MKRVGKTYTRWKKTEMPEDIRVESLRDDQMADLNRLKECGTAGTIYLLVYY
ncbi:unnamed protein product [marine sediment metagenome]|uniref:Uncharacterized protein n=1 Tax=marine sediment metagenome TaxID=412755 RepID=X1S2A7_9ZZZZ